MIVRVVRGNCGCGYLGACWETFSCGCEWDHGDLRPCDEHTHRDGEPCGCARCEQAQAESMADARRSWKPEVREPEEGEAGYRCPNCGELYDSKCRTPADRVCFQCRVGA